MRRADKTEDPVSALSDPAGAVLDAHGTILGWTDEAATLLGLAGDQACGRPVTSLLADRDQWRQALRTRTPTVWEGRVVLRHAAGHEVPVVFRVLPLGGDAGRVDAARYLVLAAARPTYERWRQDIAFSHELFFQDRMGVLLFDVDLRLVRTNAHLLWYSGVPSDLAGHRLGDFLFPEDAAVLERHLAEVLRTGDLRLGVEVLIRTREDPRGGRHMTISAFRLRDPHDGGLVGVAAFFTDITDHVRARQRLDLLHHAAAVLGESLSIIRTCEDLTTVLVPGLADLAAVDLADPVLIGEEPAHDGEHLFALRRMAVAGADDSPLPTGPMTLGSIDTHRATDIAAAAEAVDGSRAEAVSRGGGPSERAGHGGLVADLRRTATADGAQTSTGAADGAAGDTQAADAPSPAAARADGKRADGKRAADRQEADRQAADQRKADQQAAGEGAGATGGGATAGALADVGTGARGERWVDPETPGQHGADGSGDAHAGASDASDEVLAWARSVPGAHSVMTAPLHARGILLGRVTVWRTEALEPFDAEDLTLLEEVAARAGLAVDNARRYTRERRAAVKLQRSLLPPALTDVVAAETASVYLPTDAARGVGGDWFDVIPLSSARVALVVGDVVGHGLQATATMGRLRTAVRTLADLDVDPEELLTHLDDLVLQLTVEADSDRPGIEDGAPNSMTDSVGASCLYVTYDPVTGHCVMASAGHPPPALISPDGSVRFIELDPGPPLGVSSLPFDITELDLPPGSVLALYTDGLVERGTGDVDEGMAELRARLLRADALHRPLAGLPREVVTDLPPSRLPDDVTLLLARTRMLPESDRAAWTLAADPALVAGTRELVAGQLAEWGLHELTFTTELVVSELVTNAIRYAGGPVELRLIRAGVLICEVSDPSSTQPRMRRARATDEGGRGLYLVAQLTSRWGSRYTRHGKTIWTEQPLPDV
ncbi:SpoIIE family protein phosphatase [Streptomyces sp. AC536]|uniref:SpoIIE family protein phosphatase n=1 Tax=Streptomyces buecherae TaxID=2763006 RepID=UPI00164EAFB5|nr:SpoIIE family protein phosphatase [Streptomyces buecherae]MBC3984057.1 SpoIIE family protein phosphatase [Streptomyces buecherae]QNJ43413.1 SpoIIE family protein phosphatase [Streptomyces buecherae]